MDMLSSFDVLNAGTGIIILCLVALATYYQFRIRRRFSGVIGAIMFWYSLGLAALLALTVFDWIAFPLNLDIFFITLLDRVLDIIALACFLKGALVIR